MDYRTSAFDCHGCTNQCEIVEIFLDGALVARWGGRCEKWERAGADQSRTGDAALAGAIGAGGSAGAAGAAGAGGGAQGNP
jgi:hypothetical protein